MAVTAESLRVWLPLSLLALSSLLKLVVARTPDVPAVILAFLELPVSVAFLATSFVAAYAISNADHASDGLLFFIFYIITTVLVLIFWRVSLWLFGKDKFFWMIMVVVPNYAFSGFILFQAIGFLSGDRS